MVELSIILDKFPGNDIALTDLARIIRGHGSGAYVNRRTLLDTLESDEDPEAILDVLCDLGILKEEENLKVCCGTPWIEVDYCIDCTKDFPEKLEPYHLILEEIKYTDDWRKNLFDQLKHEVPYSEYEFVSLISSQVKSLDKNPVIPDDQKLQEKQYQFIGFRILSHIFETEMECLSSDGRSDLRFQKPGERVNYVGEYKVWKNRSKTDLVVDQCLNYFNSDTDGGFIFMVNNNKSSIWDEYLSNQVFNSASFRREKSKGWIAKRETYGINIYQTTHFCKISSKESPIYHFIYDLYGNFGIR